MDTRRDATGSPAAPEAFTERMLERGRHVRRPGRAAGHEHRIDVGGRQLIQGMEFA